MSANSGNLERRSRDVTALGLYCPVISEEQDKDEAFSRKCQAAPGWIKTVRFKERSMKADRSTHVSVAKLGSIRTRCRCFSIIHVFHADTLNLLHFPVPQPVSPHAHATVSLTS